MILAILVTALATVGCSQVLLWSSDKPTANGVQADHFNCSYVVYSPGKPPRSRQVTVDLPAVLEGMMHDDVDTRHDMGHLRRLGEAGAPLSIAMEQNPLGFGVTDVANTSRGLVTVYMIKIISSQDMFCLEMFARSRLFSVLIPFRPELQVLMQNRMQDVFELEARLNMPVIMDRRATTTVFNSKTAFAEWMGRNGFGAYLPRHFRDAAEATFPAMLKRNDGYAAIGSFIVQTAAELQRVIAEQPDDSYALQEAVLGEDETTIQVSARNGTLLGMFCVVYHQTDGLYIRNGFSWLPRRAIVPCESYSEASPVLAIIRDIVKASRYNGLMCINFKLVRRSSTGYMEPYLVGNFARDLPQRTPAVMSDFTSLPPYSSEAAGMPGAVIPKFFEINPRR